MEIEGKEVEWLGFDGKRFKATPKVKITYFCPDCGGKLVEKEGLLYCFGNYYIQTIKPYVQSLPNHALDKIKGLDEPSEGQALGSKRADEGES